METPQTDSETITKNIAFILVDYQSREKDNAKNKKSSIKKTESGLFEWPNTETCPPLDSYLKWIVETGEIEPVVLVYSFALIARLLNKVEPGTPIHFYKLLSAAIFSA